MLCCRSPLPGSPWGPGCSWPQHALPLQSWLPFRPPSCSWRWSRVGNTLVGTVVWAVPARIRTTGKSSALQNEAFGSKRRGMSSPSSCQSHRSLCHAFTLRHLKRARICHHSCFVYMNSACAPCIYGVPVASLGLPRSLTGLPCWQHLPWETVVFPGGGDAGHIPTAGRKEQAGTSHTGNAVVLQLSPAAWCCWGKHGAPYLVHVFSWHHHWFGFFSLSLLVFASSGYIWPSLPFFSIYESYFFPFPAIALFFHLFVSFCTFTASFLPKLENLISSGTQALVWNLGVWFGIMEFPLPVATSLLTSNPVLKTIGNISQAGQKKTNKKKKPGFNKMSFRFWMTE